MAEKAGVSRGAIEDVVQKLIDDGAVDKGKIGGTNYVWAFKAKKDRMAQLQHENTLEQIAKLKPQVAEAHSKLADAKRGREENDETEEEKAASASAADGGGDDGDEKLAASGGGGRAKKLARLDELGKKKAALIAELERLKENDPASLADLEKELVFVKQAADRWTDNIFECQSYLVKKRQMDKKEANKFLGISSGFDCESKLHHESLSRLQYYVFAVQLPVRARLLLWKHMRVLFLQTLRIIMWSSCL